MLILNIRTIINEYIYIEKFITKLVINDSKLQCKLLNTSLLSIIFQEFYVKMTTFLISNRNYVIILHHEKQQPLQFY
ncbi:hypothetical protein C6353_25730 [Bacillus toyonensis]|nr:hypothetical protein C6353_25730 [Bacillus toyonensis]